MGEGSTTGSAQDELTRLQGLYQQTFNALRETLGQRDPRSYDLAVTRLEESLMWAAKGVQRNAGRDHTSASPAQGKEEPGNDDTQQ